MEISDIIEYKDKECEYIPKTDHIKRKKKKEKEKRKKKEKKKKKKKKRERYNQQAPHLVPMKSEENSHESYN